MLDGQTEALCGVLIQKPRVHWAHPKIAGAVCQEALGECLWDVFECLGGQCFVRWPVLWGMLNGSPGGTRAIGPWMILRQLLQDRWLDSFGATTVERECIAPTAERMTCRL